MRKGNEKQIYFVVIKICSDPLRQTNCFLNILGLAMITTRTGAKKMWQMKNAKSCAINFVLKY